MNNAIVTVGETAAKVVIGVFSALAGPLFFYQYLDVYVDLGGWWPYVFFLIVVLWMASVLYVTALGVLRASGVVGQPEPGAR